MELSRWRNLADEGDAGFVNAFLEEFLVLQAHEQLGVLHFQQHTGDFSNHVFRAQRADQRIQLLAQNLFLLLNNKKMNV